MPDDIQEVVAEAAEYVSEEAEKFAEFARKLSKTKAQFAALGGLFGAAAGATVSFVIAYRKAESFHSQRADEEIAQEREHYQAKAIALEAQAGKTDLGEIVKERGYASVQTEKPVPSVKPAPPVPVSVDPPMAVQPPSTVIVAENEAAGEPDDSEMAENEVEGPDGVKIRNVFRERQREAAAVVAHEWDQDAEDRTRRPDRPYVISRDEVYIAVNDGLSEESFTYYVGDDVLCNDREEVIDPADRDRLVAEDNLERFGHGSGDPSIVYIRNDQLDILYEVVRSPNSFAEEVHGIRHEAWDRGNLERMRRRERDAET